MLNTCKMLNSFERHSFVNAEMNVDINETKGYFFISFDMTRTLKQHKNFMNNGKTMYL